MTSASLLLFLVTKRHVFVVRASRVATQRVRSGAIAPPSAFDQRILVAGMFKERGILILSLSDHLLVALTSTDIASFVLHSIVLSAN